MPRLALSVFVLIAVFATPGTAQITISTLSPTSTVAGGPTFTLTVNGSGFGSVNTVQWNGANQSTTFVSATQLTASIPSSLIASAGTNNVRVKQSPFLLTFSNTVVFTVNNPTPTLSSISPTSTLVGTGGAGGVTLVLNGTGFNASSVARLDGVDLPTTFGSSVLLNASISASILSSAGAHLVSVFTPAPGGGTTGSFSYSVTNPSPGLTFVVPSSTTVGAGSVGFTALGSGFNSQSVIRLDGVDLATTVNGAGSATAVVPASVTAAPGAHSVTVFNPTPGGGTSLGSTFTVNNPAPTLTAIAPNTSPAGSPPLAVTVTGTDFNATSVVKRNGVALTTAFVGATQLTATLSPADLAAIGTSSLTVFNPGPGGGTSTGATFTTTGNPVPVLTSLVPATLPIQFSAATITINGSGFTTASVARYDGVDCPTTFVSSTALSASINGSFLALSGTGQVTVFNPAPIGGTTLPLTFTVTSPVPLLTGMTPSTLAAGSPTTSLSLSGTNFTFQSSAFVDDVPPLPLSTVNGPNGTLTAQMPNFRLATPGTAVIKVSNPAPGGGTSVGLALTITAATPTLTSLSPNLVVAGAGDVVVLLTGTGFNPLSQAEIMGITNLVPTFINTTFMNVTIPAALTSVVATYGIRVSNGPPGGGVSTILNFMSYDDPVPTIQTQIAPAVAPVAPNGGVFAFTTTGCHPATVAHLNGAPLPTTFAGVIGGAQTIQFTVPFGVVPAGGAQTATLVNPGPAGGTGPGFPVLWNNPVAQINGASPNTFIGGSAATPMTVIGINFNPQSVVTIDDAPLPTVFVSTTSVQCTLPAIRLAAAGFLKLRVVNPAPGGGSSSPFTLSVSGPKIASASPSFLPVLTPSSPAVTINLSGLFPNPAAVVKVNGINVPSTWNSSASMSCVVAPTLAATLQPGGFALTVVQTIPSAGLGPVTSNALGVTVGVPGSPDNAGTVTVAPRVASANEEFFLRVEAPVFNQPVSLIADFTQTVLVPVVLDPAFDVALGVLFGAPFPLADGLGLLGPPTASVLRAQDLTVFGVPNPRGVFDLFGLVAPPVPFGVTFQLQAIYLDPATPFGFNVTHVNPQTL